MNKNRFLQSISFILTLVLFVSILLFTSVPAEAKSKKPKLSLSKLTLTEGQHKRLTVKHKKGKVKWSSSNKKVASVSKSGLIKAKKEGKTTITAKVGKKRLKCKVKVVIDEGPRVKTVGTIKALSAGGDFNAILNTNGDLWMWGVNDWGQLGIGSYTDRKNPIKVMTGVASVSTGERQTAILKTDGSLWMCGYYTGNYVSYIARKKPVKIMTGVASVSVGDSNTVILKKDGSLWACGLNTNGELGDGSRKERKNPVKIMTDVASVYTGGMVTAILKKDGSLWMCGSNYCGQLGVRVNDNTDHDFKVTPLKTTMTDVASVSAGWWHTAILKKDGSLWMCGSNIYGQLCLKDENKTNYSDEVDSPREVMTGVASVSTGHSHTAILKKDGSLWMCGSNIYGQLGDGSKTDRYKPVRIMTGVASVSAGDMHTAILKKDGSLWMCGRNDYGQLGDGSKTNRYKPVKVLD